MADSFDQMKRKILISRILRFGIPLHAIVIAMIAFTGSVIGSALWLCTGLFLNLVIEHHDAKAIEDLRNFDVKDLLE